MGVNNNVKYGGMGTERKTVVTETNNSDHICTYTGDTLSSTKAPYLQGCNSEMFAVSTSEFEVQVTVHREKFL